MTQTQKGNDALNQVMSAKIEQMESNSGFRGNDKEEKAEGSEMQGIRMRTGTKERSCGLRV